MKIEIKRYSHESKSDWDNFIDEADNGFFFFKRNYMEYHTYRFTDYSLMIYNNSLLVSVLPAHIKDNEIYSHQGLSYGGVIYAKDLEIATLNNIHNSIIDFFNQFGHSKIIACPTPPQYSTSRVNRYADLLKSISSKINHSKTISIVDQDQVQLPTRRRLRIPKTHEDQYCIEQVHDFKLIWPMVAECYINQHGFQPVHSTEEILHLKKCFPEHLIANTIREDIPNSPILATLITLQDRNIVKFQYIGYTGEARNRNLINFLYYKIIQKAICENKSVDMGHSIDVNTNTINNRIHFAKCRHGAIEVESNIYMI